MDYTQCAWIIVDFYQWPVENVYNDFTEIYLELSHSIVKQSALASQGNAYKHTKTPLYYGNERQFNHFHVRIYSISTTKWTVRHTRKYKYLVVGGYVILSVGIYFYVTCSA